jgi:hypothetical protein
MDRSPVGTLHSSPGGPDNEDMQRPGSRHAFYIKTFPKPNLLCNDAVQGRKPGSVVMNQATSQETVSNLGGYAARRNGRQARLSATA